MPSGIELEAHKQELIRVAKKLVEMIGSIRVQFNLPPMRKRVFVEDFDRVVQQVQFRHIAEGDRSVNIVVRFEVTAPLNSKVCEINLDCSKSGRPNRPIGTISTDSLASDLEILNERISEYLIDEYMNQVGAITGKCGSGK